MARRWHQSFWWLLAGLCLGRNLPAAEPADGFQAHKLAAFRLANDNSPAAEQKLRNLLLENDQDAEVYARLGRLLVEQAGLANSEPKGKAKQTLKEARDCFLRAQQLGSNEPLVVSALVVIKPDGSLQQSHFSLDPKLDQIIKEAEQA